MKTFLFFALACGWMLCGCRGDGPASEPLEKDAPGKATASTPSPKTKPAASERLPNGAPVTAFADIGDFSKAPTAGKVLRTVDDLIRQEGAKTTVCQVTYRLGDEAPKHEIEVKYEIAQGVLTVREYLLDAKRSPMAHMVYRGLRRSDLETMVANDSGQTAPWQSLEKFKSRP